MAEKVYKINKLGLEDLLFGNGTKVQTRNGVELVVTEINAKNLPFDATQSLQEALDLRYPAIESLTIDSPSGKVINPAIQTVADNPTYLEAVGTDLLDANSALVTVATNLLGDDTISIVALANENVNNVGNNIGSVELVADNIANVNTTAGNITNVNNVGNKITEVIQVANNQADIDIVAGLTTKITAISDDISNSYSATEDNGSITEAVSSGTGTSNITTVADDLLGDNTIGTTAGSITNVNTVASNIANVNKVGVIDTDVTKVANVDTSVPKVAAIDTDITKVANIDVNVSKVAAIDTNVTTVAANDANVTIVANDLDETTDINQSDNGSITEAVTGGSGVSAVNVVADGMSKVTEVAADLVLDYSHIEHAKENADIALANAQISVDLSYQVSANTAAIANLATAQASIFNDASITIDTTQVLIGITTNTPSTDVDVFDIDDTNDTMTFKTNASVNFFANMVFTSSTPNTRNVSIKVVNTADDAVLECFDMELTIPNGSTETISHAFLLTVGKNGTPAAPLTVRFEIVADDTGYSLDSFNAVIATSSSYDLTSEASGINYDNTTSGVTATNVQDALDIALNLDLGGIA